MESSQALLESGRALARLVLKERLMESSTP
jgi:hypothetical protein